MTATVSLSKSDSDIIRMASQSRTGRKFRELMVGNTNGYPSHSNADYALVLMIGFYTQNEQQIDRIFRNSGLMRKKWDKEVGDETYGQLTIRNALRTIRRTYTGQQQSCL